MDLKVCWDSFDSFEFVRRFLKFFTNVKIERLGDQRMHGGILGISICCGLVSGRNINRRSHSLCPLALSLSLTHIHT